MFIKIYQSFWLWRAKHWGKKWDAIVIKLNKKSLGGGMIDARWLMWERVYMARIKICAAKAGVLDVE